jgi:hypothetical protein
LILQIEEGDLFDFDEEVEPMIEVLVGRTLEQAIMEVMEEKQIANLHAYQVFQILLLLLPVFLQTQCCFG